MPGGHRGERKPRFRLAGCLLWILALAVLLIILSLLFGGFRKGTKAGLSPPRPVVAGQTQ
jgi:cytochrome c-type biogenesis protein CcmH/NrfF